MPVWCAPDGHEIEPIKLNGRRCLRVSKRAVTGVLYFVAYVSAVDEVTRYVDLADLVEVHQIRAKRRPRKRSPVR